MEEEKLEQETQAEQVDALAGLCYTKAAKLGDYQINEAERTVTQYISTKDEDRGNDVVIPGGCQLNNYKKNPVVLWGHDQRSLPIAKALWTKTDERGVISKAKFAEHQFAEDAFQLVKGGFVNGTSIGFVPLETEEKETGKFREIWGMQMPIIRRTIKKWELLEYSYVNIPMNPKALVQRDFSGLDIKSFEMKSYFQKQAELFEEEQMTEELKQEFQSTLDDIKSSIADINTQLGDIKSEVEKYKFLQESNDATQKKLTEIAGEFKTIKDARAREIMQKFAGEIVTGAISKATGNIDHLYK